MTPSQLRAKVVAERVAWIRRMLADLRVLPLATYTSFESDPRNPAAAESNLRRWRHCSTWDDRRGASDNP